MVCPTVLIAAISSTVAFLTASIVLKCRAIRRAAFAPTCRIPNPNNNRSNELCRLLSMAVSKLLADLSLNLSSCSNSSKLSWYRSATSWTIFRSYNWAMILVPSPWISIAFREAKWVKLSFTNAGHFGLIHRNATSSSRWTSGAWHSGHSVGIEYGCESAGRFFKTTVATSGIISPALNNFTVSPMRISFSLI